MDEIMSNMGHHFAFNANIGSATFELISEKWGNRNFQAMSQHPSYVVVSSSTFAQVVVEMLLTMLIT